MRAIYATDLSAASEAAIQNETCLECLDRIGVEEIHLVTVIPSNVHAGMPGMDLEGRRERALGRYRSVMEAAGFAVEEHVVRGTPHRRINGIAEAERAALSIVGSTARNLARTTVVPLLVNRIERADEQPAVRHEHLFQRVLFATDFSENAERAFDAFSYLRHATQAARLVHVRSPKDPVENVEERLADMAETLTQWDVETTIDVREGDPAEEILAAEDEVSPTTTLIGSRGRSRLRRLLLGSVSEDVVARADGNVFLVPPPRTA